MNLTHKTILASAVLLIAPLRAPAADWQPAKGPLMTRWAKDVSPEKVHPEYPRPQMVREKWTNLNCLWDYAIIDSEAPEPELDQVWGKILVPFPIESALSGVMKRVRPGQRLWYRRELAIKRPSGGGRTLLHFGAVDWQCEVFVNDKSVGKHTGGYDPFTFDITEALVAGAKQELLVAVNDPTDNNWQPRGKQVNQPKGIWYTPTTGIWQTVWLETVPAASVAGLSIATDIRNSKVRITVAGRGTKDGDTVDIAVLGREHSITSPPIGRAVDKVAGGKGPVGEPIEIEIPQDKLQPWSPDSPFLYGLRIDLATADRRAEDVVFSYFAMREIKLGKDEAGVTRMMLNGKPVFQYGPLDQGFWPDGLYTAPTDEALRYDLEVTKKLGFNMVRKHVKVEPARWYRHCDELGLLVWQDMPSGDKHAPWNPTGGHNGEEITRSPESADNFKNEWREIVQDFGHFPSIVVWVPFNEAWGQFDTVGITKFTQELDPTRLVNCASGGNDFPAGHISDLHRYPGPTIPRLEEKRAVVLGEFGGLGLPLEGHTWQAKDNWGYRSFKTKEELNSAYAQLIYKLRPLVGKGLSAAIYTQTTDVEVEVNGFMTYDREVLKLDLEPTAALHKKLYEPPPKEIVVLPTSRDEPQAWRYTTAKPADGWEKAGFDDSSWKEGSGGFGEPSTPGSKVRTEWKSPDIWLRRVVKLPAGGIRNGSLALSIHHDEDAEIYLNGTLLAAVKGYTTEYNVVPIDDKALATAWKDGDNVLAVHCHQTGGGQFIDVGLVRLVEP
jgi:beta-galactosidase/beta-glucuronidase